MKRYFSLLCIVLFGTIMLTVNSSYAADSAEGVAIYRNGAFLGLNWHAGLMNSSTADTSNNNDEQVLHVAGLNTGVTYGDYGDFVDSHTFMGYYRCKVATVPTESQRRNVRNVAVTLQGRGAEIEYCIFGQIAYNRSTTGSKVFPANITKLRCDGLVEYCYEFNGYRIFGGNSSWNISTNSDACYNAHSSISDINPKIQARDYMQNLLGDIDINNTVSAADARRVLRASASLETLTQTQSFLADVDGNGSVTSADARLILQYSALQITQFPGDPFYDP